MGTGFRICCAILLMSGLVAWGYKSASARYPERVPLTIHRLDSSSAPQTTNVADNPAMQYAVAVRDGDCARASAMTKWMQERLVYVGNTGDVANAVEQEQKRLCALLTEHRTESNQLQTEGVEDQYIFAPGVTLVALGDEPVTDAAPAGSITRSWIRVTYPLKSKALRDEKARPIRSIEVAVQVDENKAIVKAAVIGNLEIRRSSVSTRWDEPRGE